MEKRNLFVSGKAVVAAVCGAFTAAFGWLGWLVVAWAACMALDWVSGSAARGQQGRVVERCRPGRHLAQGRDGGRCAGVCPDRRRAGGGQLPTCPGWALR